MRIKRNNVCATSVRSFWTEVETFDQPLIPLDAAATMIDLGSLVVLILIACVVIVIWILIAYYLVRYTIRSFQSLTINESPSIELHPDTRVGCSNGLCYLPMFATKHRDRMVAQLGHFPTIIALASIATSYRRKIKGKLTLIEDGVAHFEKDRNERLVWEVVDELICRLDFIGSGEVRIISSRPPEGYRYTELFLPEHRNDIMCQIGQFPHLQAIVDIKAEYCMEFIGVLWQKERDKYVLEKERDMDVWAQLGKCEIRPEATID
jgi:hypothetical protein